MTLPEGLEFLQYGWWVVHVIAVWALYAFAYRKGRSDEKKEQKAREAQPGPK